MDADDDLQLNLAGFEQPASKANPRTKGNRHTVSFKKQQKVTARSTQGDHQMLCLPVECCVVRNKLSSPAPETEAS